MLPDDELFERVARGRRHRHGLGVDGEAGAFLCPLFVLFRRATYHLVLFFSSSFLFASSSSQALSTALGTAGGPKDLTQQAASASLRAAREQLQRTCQDTLRSCQSASSATTAYGPSAAVGGQRRIQIPTSLQLLARNSMALFKSVAFRGGTSVRSDLRAYYMQRLLNMPVDLATVCMYPRLFSLHNMAAGFGQPVAADALATLDPSYVVEGASVRLLRASPAPARLRLRLHAPARPACPPTPPPPSRSRSLARPLAPRTPPSPSSSPICRTF
jgi:hypothetical protein